LRDVQFVLLGCGTFAYFWGAYIVVFYLRSYAEARGFSANQGIDLVAILNGVGFLGRVIPAFLADRYGCLIVLLVCAVGTGVMCLVWIGVESYPGLVVLAGVYGFFSSGFQSLFPATVASMTERDKLGTRLGMQFAIVGLGTLTGPPIGGALVLSEGGGYLGAQIFAGLAVLGGSGILVASLVIMRRGEKGDRESMGEVDENTTEH